MATATVQFEDMQGNTLATHDIVYTSKQGLDAEIQKIEKNLEKWLHGPTAGNEINVLGVVTLIDGSPHGTKSLNIDLLDLSIEALLKTSE